MPNLSKNTLVKVIGGVVTIIAVGFGVNKFKNIDVEKKQKKFDNSGFDENGFDKYGFNKDGFNKAGFNQLGYNVEGIDKYGYNKDGYNLDGVDKYGYNKKKYDLDGYDRVGYNSEFYLNQLEKINKRLNEAYHQMQDGNYRYAVYDSRVVLEGTLKLLVHHYRGKENDSPQIVELLKICEEENLLGGNIEFLNKLHEVRRISNVNGHEYNSDESLTCNKTYFVIAQIRELMSIAEKELVG